MLTEILNIKHPIIMAPMFLVSNTKMVCEAMNNGIAGCIPALNYRTLEELKKALVFLKQNKPKHGAFGFNLIVNKSNPKYKQQLNIICEMGCDFIITSLGNPAETIQLAKTKGIKVFCDVTDLKFAQKVEHLGADAIIAVNNLAGGHRGHLSPNKLIQTIKTTCKIPIISAGGVSCKSHVEEMMSIGYNGVSVGSPFIASTESDVSIEYKNACVNFGKSDIVMTSRISGTPCTVINTPYVKKIGTELSGFERYFLKHPLLKKWAKMLRFILGSIQITNAAKKATYKTLWVAGPSIENTTKIESVKQIINRLI